MEISTYIFIFKYKTILYFKYFFKLFLQEVVMEKLLLQKFSSKNHKFYYWSTTLFKRQSNECHYFNTTGWIAIWDAENSIEVNSYQLSSYLIGIIPVSFWDKYTLTKHVQFVLGLPFLHPHPYLFHQCWGEVCLLFSVYIFKAETVSVCVRLYQNVTHFSLSFLSSSRPLLLVP